MFKNLIFWISLLLMFFGCWEGEDGSNPTKGLAKRQIGIANAEDLGRQIVFESNTTSSVTDASIKQAAATTNYETAVNLVVAGTSKKVVVRCEDCDDSLNERVFRVTSGTLTLDISGVNGTLSGDDSIGLYALLPAISAAAYLESEVTWNNRYTTDGAWTSAGANTASADYWATRIGAKSVSGWTALTSNPEFDIKMAFDSGKFGGFILVGINLEAGDSIKFVSTEGADPEAYAPTFTIVGVEQNQVKSIYCNGGSEAYGSYPKGYFLAEFKMLSYDAILDSFDISIFHDVAGTGDTIVGMLYRNFAGDSSFMEFSDDTVILPSASGCGYVDFHFGLDNARSADRKICLADSNYLIGVYRIAPDAGDFRWCISSFAPEDSGYYGTNPTDTLNWTSRTSHSPCFKAYFQTLLGTIIIGKCESPETPYYDERTDQWSNMPLY